MSGPTNTAVQQVLPDLQILRLDSVVAHEEHDAQRSEPLIERIRAAGTWLNPPIVAPMGDGRYVILDGANRHYALSALGYRYILVQVVDYESKAVQLETWYHIVSGMTAFALLRRLREVPGLSLQQCDLLSARAALARREALAYVVMGDNCAYILNAETHNLAQRTRLLCAVVDSYKQRATLNRINTDSLMQALHFYPDALAIVVFPHYEPVEILDAARNGVHLPPGITRHIIAGRAMRLHYPLQAFEENGDSLDAKNDQLKSWLQQRVAEKRVRYYAEPTFIFDE
jgi:hypothetical protein